MNDEDKQIIQATTYTKAQTITYLGINITPSTNQHNTLPKLTHYIMANMPKMNTISKTSTWIKAYKMYVQSSITYFLPYILDKQSLIDIDNTIIRNIKTNIIQQNDIGQHHIQALFNISLPSYIHKQSYINVYKQWINYSAIGFSTHIQPEQHRSKYTTHFIQTQNHFNTQCTIIQQPTRLQIPIQTIPNAYINESTTSLLQSEVHNNYNINNHIYNTDEDSKHNNHHNTITF